MPGRLLLRPGFFFAPQRLPVQTNNPARADSVVVSARQKESPRVVEPGEDRAARA